MVGAFLVGWMLWVDPEDRLATAVGLVACSVGMLWMVGHGLGRGAWGKGKPRV